MTITEQLRDAIQAAKDLGWTHYMIAKHAGIDARQIDGFMDGTRDRLRSDTMDVLCDLLGMRLTKPRVPKLPDSALATSKTAAAKRRTARVRSKKKTGELVRKPRGRGPVRR